MFKRIDQLKVQLDSQRPLPESVVKNLHEDLVLRWTYNSSAIEGNTLIVDGNGRCARLLMNLELMKSGYPPLVISVEQRLRYYQALDSAHVDGNYQPFIELVVEAVEQSFSPYFFALGIGH